MQWRGRTHAESTEEWAMILERFKVPENTMDEMLKTLRTAPPAPGQARVLYPGLSEAEEVQTRRAKGIPLHREVLPWFAECTSELGIAQLAPMS